MPEKKSHKPDRIFLQWVGSYLIISSIALLLILFSGFRYTSILRDNLIYTNGIQLDLTRAWLDQKLGLLRNITSKESFDQDILRIQQATTFEQLPRYDYYQLTKNVSSDVLNYGITDTYFLYFPAVDAMVSNTYYGQSEWFYQLSLEDYNLPYEDWMEILQQNYFSTQVFLIQATDQTKDDYLILLRPLNVNDIHTVKVNAVLIVNLSDLVQNSDWLTEDGLCIVDRDMDKLIASTELPQQVQDDIMNCFETRDTRRIETAQHWTIDGKYLSLVSSAYENWDIVVVMDEQKFSSKIVDVQNLIGLLMIFYLALSVVVIRKSAEKHYGGLRRVVNRLSHGKPEAAARVRDAYEYIDDNIQKLIQANVETMDVVEKQRSTILQELFHTLVTSPGAAAEVDTAVLEKTELPIHNGKVFYLLAYQLDEHESIPSKTPNEIREMEWFILKNVTEENLQTQKLRYLCLLEGSIQVYVVWGDLPPEQILSGVVWAYRYCQTFLSQHFDFKYHIAVSREHTGPDGIYHAYREVGRVFQYQRKSQTDDAVLYSEDRMKPPAGTPQYPAEIENRLTLAVRNGDEQSATACIQKIMQFNTSQDFSVTSMQLLANKIVVSMMQECEDMAEDTELAEAQSQVVEVNRWEALQPALLHLTQMICRKVQTRNRKADEDERYRLYLAIRKYIEANYVDSSLNVNYLSEYFERPVSFISRYFKEMSGVSLIRYIHRVRLKHAKEKLLQGDEKLEQIAASCGFGSQRSFLRIFKQYEGVTPSQYKELHGSKEEVEDEYKDS